MSETLPMSLVDLFILAERQPERLRAALRRDPPQAERERMEFALGTAEAMALNRARVDFLLAEPARWEAAMRFWHDLDPPPDGVKH